MYKLEDNAGSQIVSDIYLFFSNTLCISLNYNQYFSSTDKLIRFLFFFKISTKTTNLFYMFIYSTPIVKLVNGLHKKINKTW